MRRACGEYADGYQYEEKEKILKRSISHAWMARILPIARCPSICFISIMRTCCSGHDEPGCSVSTVTTLRDGIAENLGSITYWSRDLSLHLFCLKHPVQLPTGAEIYLYASSVWSTLFDYLLERRFISTILPSGAPCSIIY